MFSAKKASNEFWLDMNPTTGRPKSAAMSSVPDPEILMDGH